MRPARLWRERAARHGWGERPCMQQRFAAASCRLPEPGLGCRGSTNCACRQRLLQLSWAGARSLVISSNVDILHLRGRVLVDPDRSIFWVSRLLGTLRFPRFPRAFGYQSRPLYPPYSGASSRSRSHYPSTAVLRGWVTNPIAFAGAARPSLQPPISRSLPFREKTVDFGLHCFDSIFLTFCHRFSLFDEALDQQVLKLNDPGLLLSS